MIKKIFLIVFSVIIADTCHGQAKKVNRTPVVYGGFGAGLDHGGLGFKIEYLPVKRIGLFAGAGYNFNKMGTNAGISWKAFADNKSTPMIMAMYGYNAILKVQAPIGTATFSETYYGFSAGIGYEFFFGQNRNKIVLSLLMPFRGSDFKDQYDAFEAAGYTFTTNVLPVLFGIGINFAGYGRQ